MEKKGEITVFLALTMTILIPLLFTVIEAARTSGMRFQIDCVTDMAMQSVLAEYNKELLEQYDLFYLDMSYGQDRQDWELLEQHIQKYMDENFKVGSKTGLTGTRDFLELYTDTVTITKKAAASDEGGDLIKKQAVSYMADKYGLDEFLKIQNSVFDASKKAESNGFLSNRMEEERQRNENAIEAVDTRIEKEDGEYETIPVENPADTVNSKRKSKGLLGMVTKDAAGISSKRITLPAYISGRNYQERDGYWECPPQEIMGEEIWFQAYLMEKCACYTNPKENSGLDYQIEYILAGQDSDRENLQKIVNRLLVLRETSNFIYIMQDETKKAEAETMALTLSAVILFPELKDLIKLSILIAWSFAESVNDVKILLEKGKVPLMKTKESWRLGLKNALSFENHLEEKKGDGEGLGYQEYLQIFLWAEGKKEKQMRFMDIVEMDIRKTRGNSHFRLDNCLERIETKIQISSRRGRSFQIIRQYSY